MKIFLSLIISIFIILNSSFTYAMSFKIFYQSDMNLNIVVAEGKIEKGDAMKFSSIVNRADRDEQGDVILVLNSLGGSVLAAFELADIIEKVGVFTLVPDGSLCASACASILYIAGNRRNLIGSGRLGFHTCYLSDGKTIEKSSLCNEAIANHAIRHGLAHASVSLFVDDFGSGEMAWIDSDVACKMLLGMCRTSLKTEDINKEHGENLKFTIGLAKEFEKKYPSFNCKKAETIQEKMICKSSKLSDLDKKMALLYKAKILNTGSKQELKNIQKLWLKYSRNACLNEDCLVESYMLRIKELEK